MNLQQLKDTVNTFFSDTSKFPKETLEDLEDMRSHIEVMIDTLESNIEREE